MQRRSNAWGLGPLVLALTLPVGGVAGSVARADDTVVTTAIAGGATAERAHGSTAVTSGPACNGAPVPEQPEPPSSLTPAQLASLETVQEFLDLVAAAESDQSDPALFAEIETVYPGFVPSAEHLSRGFGAMEAAHVVWVREDDDGSLVMGELVYDNATRKPCRTGFLCWRAEVDEGVIDSMTLETPDGAIDEGADVPDDYPYVDGRWIPADDETSSGDTVQGRLVELCDAAIPPASAATSAVGASTYGTVNVADSGGETDACQPEPDGRLPAGLADGAPVTIRDASSGEVVGTGTVTTHEFVRLDSEELPPPWNCTFTITVTMSSTPDSITVQVGDLAPWAPVSVDDDGGFSVQAPLAGAAPVSAPPNGSCCPVATLPPDDTFPPA